MEPGRLAFGLGNPTVPGPAFSSPQGVFPTPDSGLTTALSSLNTGGVSTGHSLLVPTAQYPTRDVLRGHQSLQLRSPGKLHKSKMKLYYRY